MQYSTLIFEMKQRTPVFGHGADICIEFGQESLLR